MQCNVVPAQRKLQWSHVLGAMGRRIKDWLLHSRLGIMTFDNIIVRNAFSYEHIYRDLVHKGHTCHFCHRNLKIEYDTQPTMGENAAART